MQEIKLTQGKIALVDDEDYDWINQWRWCATLQNKKYWYAMRNDYSTGKRISVMMHRVIMKTERGFLVDHIDHDGFNNQKLNLRNCTYTQNNSNRISHGTSKYLGVSFVKVRRNGRTYTYIRAHICTNGHKIDLGEFKDEITAAQSYNEAAVRLHGEFANLNKID